LSTRRSFLSSSVAAATIAALPKSLFAEPIAKNVFTNASLGAYTQGLMTQAHFTTLIGSSFNAFHASGDVSKLTLVSVETLMPGGVGSTTLQSAVRPVAALKKSIASTPVNSFHLSFSISGKAMDQGSYLLDHGTMGSFALFVVPGSEASGAQTCGATFSSLSAAPAAQLGTRLLPSVTYAKSPIAN
jgi:hypothetical protein